jgi:predicted O-methyltransferase YrrM
MDEYLRFLTEDEELETSLLAIGDGVALSICK